LFILRAFYIQRKLFLSRFLRNRVFPFIWAHIALSGSSLMSDEPNFVCPQTVHHTLFWPFSPFRAVLFAVSVGIQLSNSDGEQLNIDQIDYSVSHRSQQERGKRLRALVWF